MTLHSSFVNICYVFLFVNVFFQSTRAGDQNSSINIQPSPTSVQPAKVTSAYSTILVITANISSKANSASTNSTSTTKQNITSTIYPNATSAINPNVTHTIIRNTSAHVNPNVTITSPVFPVSSTAPPSSSTATLPTAPITQKPSGGKSNKDYDKMKTRMWVAGGFAIVFAVTTVILAYLVYRQRKINRELEGDPSTSRLL